MTALHLPPMRRSTAGLTLIEMMIVLVIIGVASSAAVLGLGRLGRDGRAGDEAARLVAQLDMAVDEGLVQRAPLALVWTEAGYRTLRWAGDDAGWRPARSSPLALPHSLPAGVTMRRADDRGDAVLILPDGIAPPVQLEIHGSDALWLIDFDGLSARTRQGGRP